MTAAILAIVLLLAGCSADPSPPDPTSEAILIAVPTSAPRPPGPIACMAALLEGRVALVDAQRRIVALAGDPIEVGGGAPAGDGEWYYCSP